jgi:WD40 repeat protein
MPGLTLKSLRYLVCVALCLVWLISPANGQSSRQQLLRERVAVAVSPDGFQLAIARSSPQILARNSRVELWDLQTGTLRQTVTGFDGPISNVSFDPEGKSLITTSTEYRQSKIRFKAGDRSGNLVTEVKWWDVSTGEFIRKITFEGLLWIQTFLSPDTSTIAAVRYRTDNRVAGSYALRGGSSLLAISESVEVKLFDTRTGTQKGKMSGSASSFVNLWELWFTAFAFSPDGTLFAAGSALGVKIWDVTTGKRIQTIKKIGGRPYAIAFSPDSQSIAVSTGEMSRVDRAIVNLSHTNIWEVSTGKLIRNLYDANDQVGSLRFANNGKALMLGTMQYEAERTLGTVKIWDFSSNRAATFNVHEDQMVSWLQFFPQRGELLLLTGEDVEVRDIKTWRVKRSFEATNEDRASRGTNRFLLSLKEVVATGFSSDGIMVSGVISEDGFRRWDSRTGAVRAIKDIKPTDGLIARSANGLLLGEATTQEIKLWDLSTGNSRSLPRTNSRSVSAFGLSYDGNLMAISEDSQIKLRSSSDENSSRTLTGHGGSVQHLAFSNDGNTLVSADDSGAIKTWDPRTGQLKQSISTGGLVTALALDPTGQLLATAGVDYLVSVWNISTGVLQMKLRKHENVIHALVFSRDSKTLASGGDDRTAVLWDLVTGKSKQTLKGHDLSVTSLAFSPDGQLLASGSGNASVVLWNVNNGKLDRVLR